MPTVWIQQGTVLNLNPPIKRALRRVKRAYKNKDKDMFITSGNDSDHMMDSKHYDDDAVDFGINGMSRVEVYNAANDVGPEDVIDGVGHYFDVIKYNKRGIFHMEYDPK